MSTGLFPCPCCGFAVFSEPPGSYEICLICRWEDDPVQLSDPRLSGGANAGSLWECQQGILQSHPPEQARFEHYARAPSWRPLRPNDLAVQFDPRAETFKYYWEAGMRCALTGWKPD